MFKYYIDVNKILLKLKRSRGGMCIRGTLKMLLNLCFNGLNHHRKRMVATGYTINYIKFLINMFGTCGFRNNSKKVVIKK